MRRSVAVTAIVAAVAVVGACVGVGVWLLIRTGSPTGPECTVPSAVAGQDPLTLDAVQLQHASTIDAVGLSRAIPERGRVIALATAYQESSLRNLDHGDRDSLGLFQQRTSQGWGDPAQIMDPVYASNAFYDALLKVPGWQQLSLTAAAQKVQYSAYPDAYAKWEPAAQALADALGGDQQVTLTCRAGAQASTASAPVRAPVTGAAIAHPELAGLLAAAQAELGGLTVTSVTPDGTTATIVARLPGVAADVAGRALAAWAVAHGTSMAVTGVAVLDRSWSDHAWSTAPAPLRAGTVVITVEG